MTNSIKRTGFLALAAVLALSPTVPGITRVVAGHATVTAADTITSLPVLAEVAASVSKAPESV